jgi:type II secretory pathway component PulJ
MYAQSRLNTGMTVPELMIASAIFSLVSAALLVGAIVLQRTFRASEQRVRCQIEQARIIDYVGRDIRRAKTASVDIADGQKRLNLTIPDYYKSGPKSFYTMADEPRDPYLVGFDKVEYSPNDIGVRYFQKDSTIYRSVNGAATAIVRNVEEFNLEFLDNREVSIEVKFRQRHSFGGGNTAGETGTAVKAHVLLRNIK